MKKKILTVALLALLTVSAIAAVRVTKSGEKFTCPGPEYFVNFDDYVDFLEEMGVDVSNLKANFSLGSFEEIIDDIIPL